VLTGFRSRKNKKNRLPPVAFKKEGRGGSSWEGGVDSILRTGRKSPIVPDPRKPFRKTPVLRPHTDGTQPFYLREEKKIPRRIYIERNHANVLEGREVKIEEEWGVTTKKGHAPSIEEISTRRSPSSQTKEFVFIFRLKGQGGSNLERSSTFGKRDPYPWRKG